MVDRQVVTKFVLVADKTKEEMNLFEDSIEIH